MSKSASLGSVKRSGSIFPGRKSLGSVWSLQSGASATFEKRIIPYEELETKTFVNFEVNGRWQELLTPQVLSRLESLHSQQFFPAVGVQHEDGRIEILDGSNRRAYILSQKGKIAGFEVLVTTDDISIGDAKALNKDIRTHIALSPYEVGMLAKPYVDKGHSQRQIAELLGFNQSAINRALKTTVIPKEVMHLFPSVYELESGDYTNLIALSEHIEIPLEQDLLDEVSALKDPKKIIASLKKHADYQKTEAAKKNKANSKKIVEPLFEFEKGSRKKAERQISSDGNTVSYRFVRIGSEADAIIAKHIEAAMKELKSL